MTPQVLWLYGADAVGKSAVGWEAYAILAQAAEGGAGEGPREPVAYVDTDYLGFCAPAPADQGALVARNLAAVWEGFAATGARRLVVSGIVVTAEDRARFEQAIPEARFTFCRLTARPDTVRARILLRREVEEGTRGGELSVEVRAELAAYGERSVAFAELLERLALEDFAVSTDDRLPADIAGEVVARWRVIIGPADHRAG
jgi:hypothetical protein